MFGGYGESLIKLIGGPFGLVLAGFLLWNIGTRGDLAAAFKRHRLVWVFLILTWLITAVSRFFYIPSIRYQSPMLIGLIIMAGGGVAVWIALLKHKIKKEYIAAAVVLINVFLWALFLQIPHSSKGYLKDFSRIIANDIAGQKRSDAILVSINTRGGIIAHELGIPTDVSLLDGNVNFEADTQAQGEAIQSLLQCSRRDKKIIYILYRYSQKAGDWLQRGFEDILGEMPLKTLGRYDDRTKKHIILCRLDPINRSQLFPLILPERIHWLEGMPCKFFFQNLTPYSEVSKDGVQFEQIRDNRLCQSWRFEDDSAADVHLRYHVISRENQEMPLQSLRIDRHAVDRRQRPLHVLLIGGRTLATWQIPDSLADICAEQGIPVVFDGRVRGAKAGVKYEGYDRWFWSKYLSQYDPQQEWQDKELCRSPFLVLGPDGQKWLDVRQYWQSLGSAAVPDVVIFVWEGGSIKEPLLRVPQYIDQESAALEQLLTAFKELNPAVAIGVMPPVPPSDRIDSFEIYGDEALFRDFRYRYYLGLKHIARHFDRRENEGIYYLPAGMVVDPQLDYQELSAAKVHPLLLNKMGARHIAGLLAGWINSLGK